MLQSSPFLSKYPKVRPPLPDAIAAIYEDHYKSNREGGSSAASLAQKMESWLHRQVARDLAGEPSTNLATLELGAGTLNQLQYEPASPAYDIVEPFTHLFENAPELNRIRNVYSDIDQVPTGQVYDRVTSIAALEHICNLPEVVARSAKLLAPGGVFRASIPSEGTWLWTLGWKMTTGLEFRLKHRQDYGLLMQHEHVNTAAEIEDVINYCFRTVSSRVLGLHKSTSLYRYYEGSDPDLERCEQLLQEASAT